MLPFRVKMYFGTSTVADIIISHVLDILGENLHTTARADRSTFVYIHAWSIHRLSVNFKWAELNDSRSLQNVRDIRIFSFRGLLEQFNRTWNLRRLHRPRQYVSQCRLTNTSSIHHMTICIYRWQTFIMKQCGLRTWIGNSPSNVCAHKWMRR